MSEKKVTVESRYTLWDIKDSRIEIEEISKKAAAMMDADFQNLTISRYFIAIPRCTVDFMQELFQYLGKVKEDTKAPVKFRFGDFMDIEIEFAKTMDADKNGTINPMIVPGPELTYDGVTAPEYNDAMTSEMAAECAAMGVKYLLPQFYKDREIYKNICFPLMQTLDEKYGIKMADWSMILVCAAYFFRAAVQWLIEHKDDGESGVNIRFAELIEFGVRKDGPDDDIEYYTYITPSRFFKRESAKSDTITESMT